MTHAATAQDFTQGDWVWYVPPHARAVHPAESEAGFVSSTNDTYVFVRFVKDGIPGHPKACRPADLIRMRHREHFHP